MADIAIKMGVNAPANDVNGVMRIFEYIYQQPVESDDFPFTFNAFAEDFSDGAIGVLASMCFILNYNAPDGSDKEYISHVMQSFERNEQDGKPAFTVTISPNSRKLLRVIFEQRNREGNEEERSAFVQKAAEAMNLD